MYYYIDKKWLTLTLTILKKKKKNYIGNQPHGNTHTNVDFSAINFYLI